MYAKSTGNHIFFIKKVNMMEEEDPDNLPVGFINGLKSRSGASYFAALHALYLNQIAVSVDDAIGCLRLSNSFFTCISTDAFSDDDIETYIGISLSEALINLNANDIRSGTSYFRNLNTCCLLVTYRSRINAVGSF